MDILKKTQARKNSKLKLILMKTQAKFQRNSKLSGNWVVGRVDEFGGSAGYLFSSGATICPDSHGSEWKYGDGNEVVLARNSVNISKWTTGEKSFAKQPKKHKTQKHKT